MLITRAQYLAELNSRLVRHPDFLPGMLFVAVGPDTETTVGFDWLPGNGGGAPPTPFAEIAAEVHALYRVLDL